MENLTWDDTDKLAEILMENFPGIPPVALRRQRLLGKLDEIGLLEILGELPRDIYLSSVQRKMILVWHGETEESIKNYRTDIDDVCP